MNQTPDEPLWTIDDVRKLLQCDPKTVRRKIQSHGLPSIKLGGLLRFRPADVRAWIDAGQVTTTPIAVPSLKALRTAKPFRFGDGSVPTGLNAMAQVRRAIKAAR